MVNREGSTKMGFSIGVDFGSLSARAMAVDVSNGRILKESVYGYPHGIMKESLPTGRKLEPALPCRNPWITWMPGSSLFRIWFKDKELRSETKRWESVLILLNAP